MNEELTYLYKEMQFPIYSRVATLILTYLSILVDGFRVQSRGDHGWPPLACGILSSSSDIEGCRAVVSDYNKTIQLFDNV